MKPTKPDYGNWVPLAMMKAMGALAFLLLFATLLLASLLPSPVPALISGILLAAFLVLWLYMLRCRLLFDFNHGGLMGKIHQHLLNHLDWSGAAAPAHLQTAAPRLSPKPSRWESISGERSGATQRNSASRTPPLRGCRTGCLFKKGTPPIWIFRMNPLTRWSAISSFTKYAPRRISAKWFGKPSAY